MNTVKLVLIIFTLTGCAANPSRFSSDVTDRSDGVYGDWTTSTNTNDFSTWRQSVARGEISSGDKGLAFIRIETGYFGIRPGDSYICGDTNWRSTLSADLAWMSEAGEKYIETTRFKLDDANEELNWHFNGPPANDFLCKLNTYDKLALKYTDSCGTYTYVTYNIEGNHHLSINQLLPDGNVINCGVQKRNEVTVPRTQESSALLTQNFPDGFTKGEMRLVKLGLFSGYGAAVKSAGTLDLLYSLYKQGDWVRLVNKLPGRMGDDGHYFLLGIAAEKLGYLEAARTYYSLSIDMSKRPMISKCISSCFGHKFPEDAILRRSRLDIN